MKQMKDLELHDVPTDAYEKTCYEKFVACFADFFQCDRKLFPDEQTCAHYASQDFSQALSKRQAKYEKYPIDMKLLPEKCKDMNRLRSCLSKQWWLQFLCCKAKEETELDDPSEYSEKHIRLQEKTIEDFYQKDPNPLVLTQNKPVSVKHQRQEKSTKINMFINELSPENDQQLDSIDLEKFNPNIVQVRPASKKGSSNSLNKPVQTVWNSQEQKKPFRVFKAKNNDKSKETQNIFNQENYSAFNPDNSMGKLEPSAAVEQLSNLQSAANPIIYKDVEAQKQYKPRQKKAPTLEQDSEKTLPVSNLNYNQDRREKLIQHQEPGNIGKPHQNYSLPVKSSTQDGTNKMKSRMITKQDRSNTHEVQQQLEQFTVPQFLAPKAPVAELKATQQQVIFKFDDAPQEQQTDAKKRKKPKTFKQPEAPAEQIIIEQVNDVKKKKRIRKQNKQDFTEEIDLGQEEVQDNQPKRKKRQEQN